MYKPPDSTLALWGVLLGIAVAFIYFMQWRAMDQAMRIDERAWITIIQKEKAVTVSAPTATLQITNTGKTPALEISAKAFIEVVPLGTDPHFDRDPGVPASVTSTGVLIPNYPHEFEVVRRRRVGSSFLVEEDSFTTDEATSLKAGKSYMATYGTAVYQDIFHQPHWIHFCFSEILPAGTYAPPSCAEYNAVDEK